MTTFEDDRMARAYARCSGKPGTGSQVPSAPARRATYGTFPTRR